MRFSDLLSQIGQAGFEAALTARKASQMTLRDALEVNMGDSPNGEATSGDNVEYKFKRIFIRMPGPTLGEDKGQLISIPLWAMLTGGNLDLDELRATIEAEVDLSSMDKVNSNDPVPASDLKLELRKGLTKRNSAVKIEMTFKLAEPPELAEQLRDKLVAEFKEALKDVPIAEEDA